METRPFFQFKIVTLQISAANRLGAIKYIEKQKEHHKIKTFKEEFLTMLKMAQIQYDEKYLWD